MNGQPWVEKYRPQKFKDIVLENNNKLLLGNIIKKDYFPNLLLYGPPGTGKTTTIINLINEYQISKGGKNKGLIIHLNASDARGVDIVRNQIKNFVNTKTLFRKGIKFVILDEVDYMTKNAQVALRYLIQLYSENIRFCLICNYISRIELVLQNEFIRLKFCNLPSKKIILFLKNIVKNENLNINDKKLVEIQKIFKSDMRSMINFLQVNNNFLDNETINIISEDFFENLIENYFKNKKTKKEIKIYIEESCIKFNIRVKNFIVKVISYLIHNKDYILNEQNLTNCQIIITYIEEDKNDDILNYFLNYIFELYTS